MHTHLNIATHKKKKLYYFILKYSIFEHYEKGENTIIGDILHITDKRTSIECF